VYRIARIIKSLHREFRPVKSGAFALNGQHRKDHCRVAACELTSTLQSQIDTAISNRKKEQESTALDSQYLRNRVSFRSSAGPRGGGMAMSKTSRSWCVLYGLVLLQFFVSTASAEIILQTPAGLTEGEKFRFIFLTSGTTTAESTTIADYNSFVNTQAQGATYDGNVVSWYAVASTANETTAYDNVRVGGLDSAVPVYLVTGTIVADNMTTTSTTLVRGLWSTGEPTAYPLYAAVNVGIDGTPLPDSRVWTGTSGYGGVTYGLGYDAPNDDPDTPGWGYSYESNRNWVASLDYSVVKTIALPMYAVSQELTANAVPEPGTLALTGVAGLLMFGRRIWRRLRPNRSRP
jgi:hypothetical protein